LPCHLAIQRIAREENATGNQRFYVDHMFAIDPAAAYIGGWLQCVKYFPPQQKPGRFRLDHEMEAVTGNAGKQ
jgi:hypothetical protein